MESAPLLLNVIAALVISGPAFRPKDERISSELADLVQFSSQELPRRLGFLASKENAKGVVP